MQLHGLWKWTFWVFEWMSIIEFLHIHGNMITAGQSYYVCWRWPLTMSTCWSSLSKPCFAGIHGFGNWWMSAEFPSWMLFPWDVFSPVSAFCSRMPLRFTKELGGWFTMVATALNDMSCFRTPPLSANYARGGFKVGKLTWTKDLNHVKAIKGKMDVVASMAQKISRPLRNLSREIELVYVEVWEVGGWIYNITQKMNWYNLNPFCGTTWIVDI